MVITAAQAHAGKLKVIATFPDLKWAAEQVGGTEIKVEALAKGSQDPHHVDAKPSFMLKLNRADVFIQNGMEQEIGWVPPLLEGARNAKILKGASGFIDVSIGIEPKEVPVKVDRSLGDVHPSGNPHFLMDPACVLVVFDNIFNGFAGVRPEKSEYFKNNLDAAKKDLLKKLIGEPLVTALGIEQAQSLLLSGEFDKQWKNKTLPAEVEGWLLKAKPLENVKVLYYHQSWKYFTDRFKIKIAGYMEPKPGIPPSPAHLLKQKNKIINEKIPLIVTSTYHHPKTGKKLEKMTSAKALWLPNLVGGVESVKTYPDLIEHNIGQMVNALSR
jgi:ABC-type Zn uptake system ZnuABC Zn-binding protein ZnuA